MGNHLENWLNCEEKIDQSFIEILTIYLSCAAKLSRVGDYRKNVQNSKWFKILKEKNIRENEILLEVKFFFEKLFRKLS